MSAAATAEVILRWICVAARLRYSICDTESTVSASVPQSRGGFVYFCNYAHAGALLTTSVPRDHRLESEPQINTCLFVGFSPPFVWLVFALSLGPQLISPFKVLAYCAQVVDLARATPDELLFVGTQLS